MIGRVGSRHSGGRARYQLAVVAVAAVVGLWGCEGGVGVSYAPGGYYGPYDYDYDYDYGAWGPDYYVGPPVVVGGVVRDHDRDHGHDGDYGGGHGRPAPHYRAPAPARHLPSIPSRSRPR